MLIGHLAPSHFVALRETGRIVYFGGAAEELQEAIEGGSDESDALCEKVHNFWVEYNKGQKEGAEWSVVKYDDWADCRVDDPKEGGKKVSELPVHKVPVPVFN